MSPHILNAKVNTQKQAANQPLAWIVAIVCTILAIAVIITGIVISTIYVIYRPKMPHLKVAYAHLNKLHYD